MKISMFGERGIGWWCWSVSASVSGVSRTLARGLTKDGARHFVNLVERLRASQAANSVPDGCRLRLDHSGGRGHGHWLLVWDPKAPEARVVFEGGLTAQAAPKRRDAFNAVLDTIDELRFSVEVVDHLRTVRLNNTALMTRGAGPAVQVLARLDAELRKHLFELEHGRIHVSQPAA